MRGLYPPNRTPLLPDRTPQLDYRLAPLLRVDDVAAILQIDPRTVRRLAAKGQLTPVRIGGSVRFTADDVQALVDAGRGALSHPPETPNGARESAARPKTAGGSEPPRRDRS